MDIASVYLNFASLLGTEIEVEGYYFWQRLYSAQKDQQSPNIALPHYVRQQGLVNVGGALSRADYWTKVTFQGYLKQNHRGDLILDRVSSITYTTEDIQYRASLIYDQDTIRCEMQGDVIVNDVKPLSNYTSIQETILGSQRMSINVLLKGFLVPPYDWNGNFSVRVDGLAADRYDLLQQFLLKIFIALVVNPLIFCANLKRSGFQTALRVWHERGSGFESLISVQNQDNQLLRQYFGPEIIEGGMDFQDPYGRWRGENIQFLFAGQLVYLSRNDKHANQSDWRRKLKFVPLDYIHLSKTITFDRPQDE